MKAERQKESYKQITKHTLDYGYESIEWWRLISLLAADILSRTCSLLTPVYTPHH